MNEKMIELLIAIEKLETDELKKIGLWVEFNLQKREDGDFSKNLHIST